MGTRQRLNVPQRVRLAFLLTVASLDDLFEHPARPLLMSESGEQYLQRAIATLSQSDPIVKLLQEIKLGRMKPTDPGLRAITEAWLGTYQKVLENAQALDRIILRRLDPLPRLDLLIAAGILPADHPGVMSLRASFEQALRDNQARSAAPG